MFLQGIIIYYYLKKNSKLNIMKLSPGPKLLCCQRMGQIRRSANFDIKLNARFRQLYHVEYTSCIIVFHNYVQAGSKLVCDFLGCTMCDFSSGHRQGAYMHGEATALPASCMVKFINANVITKH